MILRGKWAIIGLVAALCALTVLGAGCGRQVKDNVQRMQVSSVDTTLPANKHVVRQNDSLWKISQQYHVSVEQLLSANPSLSSDGTIYPNQTLTIPSNQSLDGFESQVLALTNDERAKAGLQPCAGTDANLNRSAKAKSEDMAATNYFAHDSPTYGDPFAMMRNFGVQFSSAGENIAMGQPTPQAVVEAWMNSPGHRANILKGEFTHLGVGYIVKDGKPYWTQQFIGK
ncbi:CAP domain-containing protein [Cohnella sp. GCM10027633]|uniref:CAP domain-containing protein n=1 Tax=unclassified Cohnella TaxID=2636738 RepID=UPI003630C723